MIHTVEVARPLARALLLGERVEFRAGHVRILGTVVQIRRVRDSVVIDIA